MLNLFNFDVKKKGQIKNVNDDLCSIFNVFNLFIIFINYINYLFEIVFEMGYDINVFICIYIDIIRWYSNNSFI